jgi:hypothetical protein
MGRLSISRQVEISFGYLLLEFVSFFFCVEILGPITCLVEYRYGISGACNFCSIDNQGRQLDIYPYAWPSLGQFQTKGLDTLDRYILIAKLDSYAS